MNYNIKKKYQIPLGKFKVYSQQTEEEFDAYSCGPRCLQTILEDCQTDKEGTYLCNTAEAAEAYGVIAKYRHATVELVKRYIRKGYLVIISFPVSEDACHSVVAFNYDNRFIYALDAATYSCILPLSIIDAKKLRELWQKYPEDAELVAVKAKG